MNKYKDALNELFVYSKHSANKVEILSLTKCYEKLEQLIEEYFKLKEKYERLEKALDKACEELESYDYKANLRPNYYEPDSYKSSKEWKEWCLRDGDN